MNSEVARLYRVTADRVAVAESMPVGPVLVAELCRLRSEPMDAPTAASVHGLWDKVISWANAEQMVATYDTVHGLRGRLEADSRTEAQMLAARA